MNKVIIQCSNCNSIILSWSLIDVVHAGFWCESPSDTSYVFDQQLFRLWDSIQKRMPGTSESSFIHGLEDVSVMKGRVCFSLVELILFNFPLMFLHNFLYSSLLNGQNCILTHSRLTPIFEL